MNMKKKKSVLGWHRPKKDGLNTSTSHADKNFCALSGLKQITPRCDCQATRSTYSAETKES